MYTCLRSVYDFSVRLIERLLCFWLCEKEHVQLQTVLLSQRTVKSRTCLGKKIIGIACWLLHSLGDLTHVMFIKFSVFFSETINKLNNTRFNSLRVMQNKHNRLLSKDRKPNRSSGHNHFYPSSNYCVHF